MIGENAVVGAMPTEEEQGVATIGPDVCVGTGAKIGSNAMISEDVKDGEENDKCKCGRNGNYFPE